MAEGSNNGWRHGRDPIQRWLRVVFSATCLGVFAWLAVAGERAYEDIVVIVIALGSGILLLGYEGIVRLPFIEIHRNTKRDDEDKKDGDDDG